MGKTLAGKPLYELKCDNPNKIANFSEPKLAEACAKDFLDFVGIKGSDAKALIEKVKKDMVAKKVKEPWIRGGLSGSDLILLVTDLQPTKYEVSCTLFAGYIAACNKQKNQSALVVNAQKGDKVIDDSADRMAKAKGTDVKTVKEADFSGLDDSTPIILLAHGSEDKSSTGTVWGQKFAGVGPEAIVNYLVKNPDKKKRLGPNYSGTIYLDGCFTAQVGGMGNYTQKVWQGLKAAGVKKCVVKGNLGAAITEDTGDETIITPEADKAAKKLLEDANKKLAEANKVIQAKKDKIWQTKYLKKNDKDGYAKDAEIIQLKKDSDAKLKELQDKFNEDIKKVPGYRVTNLVGKFGLEVIK
jgi:hypothetical protein